VIIGASDASSFISLRPGERITAGVIATPADANVFSRFQLTQRSRDKVVGGVMVLFPAAGGLR
jgi:hypothetical protein